MGQVEDPPKIDEWAMQALALGVIKMKISWRLGVHFERISTGILIPRL